MKLALIILLGLILMGCGSSRSSESNSSDSSNVIIPEDGGEPILKDEGP